MTVVKSSNILVFGQYNNKHIIDIISNFIKSNSLIYNNIKIVNIITSISTILYHHFINEKCENYLIHILNLNFILKYPSLLNNINGIIIYYNNTSDKDYYDFIIKNLIHKKTPIIYVKICASNLLQSMESDSIDIIKNITREKIDDYLYLKINDYCDLPFIKMLNKIFNIDISNNKSFNNYNKNIEKHIQYYNSSHILSTIIRNDPSYIKSN